MNFASKAGLLFGLALTVASLIATMYVSGLGSEVPNFRLVLVFVGVFCAGVYLLGVSLSVGTWSRY